MYCYNALVLNKYYFIVPPLFSSPLMRTDKLPKQAPYLYLL